MTEKSKGLTKAQEIYQNRSSRVKALKEEGKKIIGYPCMYVPIEMITALDMIPYRTCGDMAEPVTEADRALPAAFCPIMRSCLDCALKGKDDFIDGMVAVHSCDPQEKTARVWESYIQYPFFHFIDMPGTLRPEVFDYHRGQLNDFKKALESFTGKELTNEKLKEAIASHNEQRKLVRELYDLTKPHTPLASGSEILQVIKSLMSLPVHEGNELLVQVIDELKERSDGPSERPARLLIWSSTLDDIEIMKLFENGANVVMDEGCGGLRPYRKDVKLTADPLDALAHYALEEITGARTFKEAIVGDTTKDYVKDLESRFGYLKEMIKEWNVNGAVYLIPIYCDPFAYEMPSLKDYFDSLKIPSIYLEHDYTRGALAPMKTRVEAFLETIE